MGKKVSIVFEETEMKAEGKGFNVYLDGMTQERMTEINAMTPEKQLEELGAAEFWALRCFQITMHAMSQTGVVKEIKRRD